MNKLVRITDELEGRIKKIEEFLSSDVVSDLEDENCS